MICSYMLLGGVLTCFTPKMEEQGAGVFSKLYGTLKEKTGEIVAFVKEYDYE